MIFHSFLKPIPYLDYLNFQLRSRKKRRESILFLEHPPTITAGISSRKENLLFSREYLEKEGVQYREVVRGGDHTGHEPGQLVVYWHLDLTARQMSVGEFLTSLQDTVIQSVQEIWNITLVGDRNRPGLYWQDDPEIKIVSIGVYFKSYFTSFGMAINLNNSGNIFRYINPCGISSSQMRNLASLGANIDLKGEFIELIGKKWKFILEKKYPPKTSQKVRWL